MDTSGSDDLISVARAAKIRDVSRVQLWYYIRSGRLPAVKIGKTYVLKRADVVAFVPRGPGRPRKSKDKSE